MSDEMQGDRAAGDDGGTGTTPVRFEDALAALDDVIARLEGGEVGLEEAIALFEQGQKHLAACRQRLEVATARVEELTREPEAPEQPF